MGWLSWLRARLKARLCPTGQCRGWAGIPVLAGQFQPKRPVEFNSQRWDWERTSSFTGRMSSFSRMASAAELAAIREKTGIGRQEAGGGSVTI